MRRTYAVALVLLCTLTACSQAPTSPSSAASIPNALGASDLTFCVQQTNSYRATVGRPALTQSSTLEAFAVEAAHADAVAHVGHQHFQQTGGGSVSLAENEIPWWPLSAYGSSRVVLQQALAGMWSEGPTGGHYQNIAGGYTQLGCGGSLNGNELTITQEFR